jgi:intermediate cleaving peptidase 55
VRPKDEKEEIWDGARSGVQAAQDVFNADEAQSIEALHSILPDIINGAREVYTDIGSYSKKTAVEKFIMGDGTGVEGMQKALKETARVRQLRPLMNEIRLKKSDSELNNMRRAGAASGFVITQAMTRDYTSEKQLWADLSYGFRSHGLDGDAYVPVVAGGQNGLSIHYVRNDCQLRSGETVLVDAGGEYGGYVADITRTWPVDKTFSPAQRDLYTMLLETQKNVVEMCKESANLSLDRLHRITDNMLRDGLKDLGFDVSGRNMEQLFPHHVGHFVGLDVHDAPGHPRTGSLVEGNCITIEPGVYVPDDERWPERFRGLAMRVEDSVIIGKDAPEVLTATAAKEIDEIEALRAGK